MAKQELPPWWRDVDRSIRLGIAEYEFVIMQLEALLAGTSNKSFTTLNSRKWENLLAEAGSAGKRIRRSLTLAAARRRDANTIGLILPNSRELAARIRAASAKFHVVSGLARGRMARMRIELKQLDRPRNSSSVNTPPSQIDVHI